ncbi:MAG: YtfJ family protein [Polyangia bacterium]
MTDERRPAKPSVMSRAFAALLAPPRTVLPLLLLVVSLLVAPLGARADGPSVGTQLSNADIRDAKDEPSKIPDFGKKVLLILYTDPNVADQNDEFGDQVKALGLDRTYYHSMGIANMKDAPGLANWLIRLIIRKKIKKYNVTILTDPDLLLAKAWNLGVCDDKSVVMLIDHKGVLQYIYKGALPDTEKKKAIDLMKELIAKLKAEHPSPEGAQPAGAASPAPAAGTSPPAAPAN